MSASTAAAPVKRLAIRPSDWDAKLDAVQVNKSDLNRLVMDYLVVEGYKEAAENFAREAGMDPQADFESIQTRMTIRNAIQQGDIEDAIERVNDLNPEILDNNPSLYFHLQQQRMIELIRQKKIDEALDFAQQELAPRGEEHPEFLAELERTMTLLAYDVDLAAAEAAAAAAASAASMDSATAKGAEKGETGGIPDFVTSLLHPAHRQSTAAQVNAAILTSQSHGPTPKLPNLLRMLAWGEILLAERADFPSLDMQVKTTTKDDSKKSTSDVEMVV